MINELDDTEPANLGYSCSDTPRELREIKAKVNEIIAELAQKVTLEERMFKCFEDK